MCLRHRDGAFGDSGAGVFDGYLDMISNTPRPSGALLRRAQDRLLKGGFICGDIYRNLSAIRRKFKGIRQNIQQNLLYFVAVKKEHDLILRCIEVQVDVSPGR